MPIAMNLSLKDQQELKSPAFVAFQVRITDTFQIEQVGSGYPCRDESKLKEIFGIIEEKNQTVPLVILFSWRGGFAVGAMNNQEASYDELVLHHYHEPQRIGNEWSNSSIRHFKMSLGKPPEMIREEMLPTIDLNEAEKIFQQKIEQLKAETSPRTGEEETADAKESSTLRESQMIVLSKGYPETIDLMRSRAKREEVYAAYRRDMFAMTGKMFEPLTFNQEQFWKTATSIQRNRRARGRKNKTGIDPLEYELVAGWYFRGYGDMSPENRRAALESKGFRELPSAEVIRKLCRKLKLPPLRKAGRH